MALFEQQIRRRAHPPREQILTEGHLPELLISPLQLARGARQRTRHQRQRELLAVMARDEHPRQQVQPVTSRCGVVAHISLSDLLAGTGRLDATLLASVSQPA
jgi:hypothetical protein